MDLSADAAREPPDMFSCAQCFKQAIGEWGNSNVLDMKGMFIGAHCFNWAIGEWGTSKVLDMKGMLRPSDLENVFQVIGSS